MAHFFIDIHTRAQRYAKRHGIPIEEAECIYLPQRLDRTVPYIDLRSFSTGGTFRLYIEKREVAEPQPGIYGLSSTGTVPIF